MFAVPSASGAIGVALGIGEAVHDLVERAVAAGRDDAIDAALALGDVAARVARCARREELDRVAARFERAHQRARALATAAAARGGVADHEHLQTRGAARAPRHAARARGRRAARARARRSRPRASRR